MRGKLPIAIEQPENRKRELALRIALITRQMSLRFDQSVEGLSVTRAQWRAIAAVARQPGATQRTIATLLKVTEVTAGRLIDRLCIDGYLERREDPGDRRAHCIFVTPSAQPVLDRLSIIAKTHEEETFAGLSEEELESLEAVLEKISHNLSGVQSWPEPKKAARVRETVTT